MYDIDSVWQRCLSLMEEQNIVEDKICFETYFKGASLVSINDTVATITTLMKFNISVILEKKLEIEAILSSILSLDITIIVCSEEDFQATQKDKLVEVEIIPDNLNKNLTFESFVIGSSNRMAQNAAFIVSTNPGKNFNPLFLYSNPGLGKTHLLHSIGNFAKKTNPNLQIRYVTSKDFVDEIIEGMKHKHLDDVYKKYDQIDILLIDDIQFLFGKEKSSEIFFHIFNSIITNNKQIVITSDKKPEELQGIEDRLISRFQSGLSFGIDPPEFETARAILERKIENLDNSQLVIHDEVIDFLSTNYCHDIRSLEGALKRVFFCSIMHSTNNIDMAFIIDAFKIDSNAPKINKSMNKDLILKTTSEFYYLTVAQLLSKNRTKILTTPREISMYLMRELLDLTFAEIGSIYSGRDHSTIMKACARVQKKISTDKDYRLAVSTLKDKLGTNK